MYEKVTHIPDSQRHRTAGAGGWWSGGGGREMFANLLNAVKRRDRFTLEELRRLNDVVARTTTVTTANRDALVETFRETCRVAEPLAGPPWTQREQVVALDELEVWLTSRASRKLYIKA